MQRPLRDKAVLITGASRGFGRETAVAFARRGARVAASARSTVELEAVARDIRDAGGQSLVCSADVSSEDEINVAVEKVLTEWSRIDILVNTAGIKREGPVDDRASAHARETLEVNFLGTVAFCQRVLPIMHAQHAGHIINVSSVLGKRATPHRAAYSASKAALNAWTDALRVELMTSGIDVTLVCPGRLSDGTDESQPRFAMNNKQAAERIVQCAARPKRELILTPAGRILTWLDFFAPALVDRILKRSRMGSERI